MRITRYISAALSLGLLAGMLPIASANAATFTPNLVMDDSVFNNSGSMTAQQIDAWLDSLASSCISPKSGFAAIIPNGYTPSGGYTYGGYSTAGAVIAAAAQAYDINPQVILATLQKEQSLVSASSTYCNDGDDHKYAAAVGYGCPDSGTTYSYTGLSLYRRNGVVHGSVGPTCVNTASKAGFSQQVIRAAWLLKFGQQRSEGNTAWAVIKGSWDNSDDKFTCYGGPMTQGNLKRCPSDQNAVYYDGYTVIDGVSTHMDTGPTAAFYWYTPHFHGNQSLVNIFTDWFGGTISASYYACHDASNIAGADIGEHIRPNSLGNHTDLMTLVVPNQTSTSCVEVHTWANNGYQQWLQHIATNYPALNPTTSKILYADTNGDGRDEAYLINYTGTSTGMIEVHGWDSLYRAWFAHTPTNRPSLSSADAEVITADTNGDGKDEFYLVQYRNTASGRVEVHGWSSDFRAWTSHIATNYPALDPSNARVIAGDMDGDGKDEFILVNYNHTSTGMVELHPWTVGLQNWAAHIATNRPAVPTDINEVVAADTNGDHRDEFYFMQYRNTGSGKMEIHGWTPNFKQWVSHIATSQNSYL